MRPARRHGGQDGQGAGRREHPGPGATEATEGRMPGLTQELPVVTATPPVPVTPPAPPPRAESPSPRPSPRRRCPLPRYLPSLPRRRGRGVWSVPPAPPELVRPLGPPSRAGDPGPASLRPGQRRDRPADWPRCHREAAGDGNRTFTVTPEGVRVEVRGRRWCGPGALRSRAAPSSSVSAGGVTDKPFGWARRGCTGWWALAPPGWG